MESLVIDDKIIEKLTDEEQEQLESLYEARDNYEKQETKKFSVCITENWYPEIEKFSLVYILNNDYSIKESNHIRRLDGKTSIIDVFKMATNDFNNRRKSVLLYLGKFPGYGFDIDGGSILARQLINSLKIRCNLTVCFIRKNKETFSDPDVCEVRYVEYKDPWNNKFIRRLENLETNFEALHRYNDYDVIIAGHISKFYGMDRCGVNFWKKTIIFPMFCTSSYIRAGEKVPSEYTEQEQIVIDNVSKIVTPSIDEKKDLIRDYNCEESKISVVNRGITPYIHYKKRLLNGASTIKLVCIGTIKTQKNTKAALELLKKLENRNIQCELHLVATIQDKKYYDEFCELVKYEKFGEKVKYHISISQEELAELLDEMDINISMSSWETFGRGIFEGACAGLPTFVFDMLETVKELSDSNDGFCFSKSVDEMADNIIAIVTNKERYQEMSGHLSIISHKFSYKNEQNLLLETIFSVKE